MWHLLSIELFHDVALGLELLELKLGASLRGVAWKTRTREASAETEWRQGPLAGIPAGALQAQALPMTLHKATPHYLPGAGNLRRVGLPPGRCRREVPGRLRLRPLLTDDEDGSDEENSPRAGEGARVLPVGGGPRARGLAFLEGPIHDGHLEDEGEGARHWLCSAHELRGLAIADCSNFRNRATIVCWT